MSRDVKMVMLLMVLLFILALQKCVVNAATYAVVTEQDTLAKTIINYTPTQSEMDCLGALTERFYQSNKSISDKYYVYRATRFICNRLSFDYNYKITGERAFTPFPALDTRKAVCMGYTALMHILLDKKGIINILVYDTRRCHIWNRMLVDGDWIDVDVTSLDRCN